jgi:hypothetical protein
MVESMSAEEHPLAAPRLGLEEEVDPGGLVVVPAGPEVLGLAREGELGGFGLGEPADLPPFQRARRDSTSSGARRGRSGEERSVRTNIGFRS